MENQTETSTKKTNLKKPKWLRKLEEESWQAELVISGLAIYGALQVPHLIEGLIDFSITFFQPGNYFFIFIFCLYLFCGSTFLISCFVIHFILRAIWIGMLGLNYVFPKGINYETEQYSPTFLKLLKEKFPNDHQDIIRLEKACSTMFGIATTILLVLTTININVLILFSLKMLLEQFIPLNILVILGTVILAIIFLISILISILNMKRFHSNEWQQTWYFKLGQAFNKFNYHIFYYPITRITFLFVTNSSIKKFTTAMFVVFFLSGILASFQMVQSNLYLMDDPYSIEDKYNRTDKMIPEHYEANLDGSQKLFSAVIPAEKISDDLMKVFVPVFINERVMMDSLCGKWQNIEGLNRRENKRKRRERWVSCAQQYHRFLVNDSLYVSEVLNTKHANQGENGISTYLPTEKFSVGKNILRIEKVRKDGSVYRTINIPFWFEKY